MKAAQINEYGDKDVLITTSNAEKPIPADDEVLVEVSYAGVNPFDWKVRAGYMKDFIPLNFPATLGGDLSGTIAEIGKNVSEFSVGQSVFGQANAVSGVGSYAEFAPVVVDSLVQKPENIDFETAAGAPLAGVSAIQALVDIAQLQSGQKVLVHGGAGGIGSIAIQLAKYLGAYVATTTSSEDFEYVKNLAVDEVIDYKTQNFTEIIKDYDVVFDTVGGETFTKSHQVLKSDGILLTMAGQPDEELAKKYDIRIEHISTQVTSKRLSSLSELLAKGAIKINIDKVFPLDQAGEAQAYIHAGHHRGKVILKIK